MREVGRVVRAEEAPALSEAEPEAEDQGPGRQEEGAEEARPGEAFQRLTGTRAGVVHGDGGAAGSRRDVGGRDRTDVVEAVRAQADLRAIVSDYLPLKK